MEWSSISEAALWDEINAACLPMTPAEARIWEAIKIVPEKWRQHPYGDEGGGFWVVAVIGRHVVWFNDIEDGFNPSTYSKYGQIEEYQRVGWAAKPNIHRRIRRFIEKSKREI